MMEANCCLLTCTESVAVAKHFSVIGKCCRNFETLGCEWDDGNLFIFIIYTDLWWYIQDNKFSNHRIANQATSISIRLRRAYVRCGEIMFEKLLNLVFFAMKREKNKRVRVHMVIGYIKGKHPHLYKLCLAHAGTAEEGHLEWSFFA